MKTSLSDLRKIIREELTTINEQPADPAKEFYSAKMGFLNHLMDNLDEAHSALDAVAELAQSLSAHEQTAAAEDEEFMEHMLELEENVVNLRDNKIDPAIRDIKGELDAVQAMVSSEAEWNLPGSSREDTAAAYESNPEWFNEDKNK
tara:strand:+ start:1221 stop:1661 length:441 start_codon:yes stop_codon:yes gene_type:complete